MYRSFSVAKRTGTHADVLIAVGLADLLAAVVDQNDIRVVDRLSNFEVDLPAAASIADLQRIPQAPGYPFLKANQKTKVPQTVRDFVDYAVEKAKADRNRERSRQRKKQAVDAETRQLMDEESLREDWPLLRVLNVLQADEATNRIYETIVSREPSQFRTDVARAFEALSRGDESGLAWKATQVQLFTPIGAKGYARLKPDSTDRNDKTKEQWTDPFREWLKYRGYFRVTSPFLQDADVRLLCPIPCDISIRALEKVGYELRKIRWSAGVKLDNLAVLKLAELLIRHSEEFHDLSLEIFPGLSLKGRTPAQVISGLAVTHYQSMGSAKIVAEMSTLALPGWFPIESSQDAQEWLAILNEHQRAVGGLRSDYSDEAGLLLDYRRFLQKRGETAVWALIEFLERYGPFVMRANGLQQSGRVRWVTRFTDVYFRRVLMGLEKKLLEIVDNSGFEAVARAVRQSTVTSQNRKARRKDVWREIRYELLHDLHRTRKAPGTAFVESVMEFISRYNYENARHREVEANLRAAPPNVSDEELKSFLELIEQHGSSLVGALLAAYGSCKEKWEGEDSEVTEATASDGDDQERSQ